MQKSLFEAIEKLLTCNAPQEKFAHFERMYAAYKKGEFVLKSFPVRSFAAPSYASFCTVVSPRDVPKRKNLTSVEGQINMLHAIAHIEYSAIDLALDICYRFQNMPKAFYDDWLRVAEDEIRHFRMIESLLHSLGATYGAIAVHDALFEAAKKTEHSLLERLAVVPRYLEANGLDATPSILQKMEKLPAQPLFAKIGDALRIILDEEIEHVKKGDFWFSYLCKREGVAKSIYFDIIFKHYPRGFRHLKRLNADARLAAGFTCNELNRISEKHVC